MDIRWIERIGCRKLEVGSFKVGGLEVVSQEARVCLIKSSTKYLFKITYDLRQCYLIQQKTDQDSDRFFLLVTVLLKTHKEG